MVNQSGGLWSMRKLDWKQDGSNLREEAEIYYQEAINTHKWGRKSYRPDVQYAFKSTTSNDEWTEGQKEKYKSKMYKDEIKALTAKLKEYTTAYTSRWSGPNEVNHDQKYAWKMIPPKDGDPTIKKVHVNGISKTYYWCPYHLQWTVHSPKECKRLPAGKGKKKQSDKKVIKRSQFKERKKAYIHTKAAYEACMNTSTDSEEETSNSDNDEDSSKSVSTYSSEDSNHSLLVGCEEWRPKPPHATHLYLLIYWKQIRNWIRNFIAAVYILTYILIQGLYHGMTSTRAWIYHMYINKHTRQKSLRKYMKSWRSRLARLNDMFNTYIKRELQGGGLSNQNTINERT
jgi:hypothetical protein